MDAHDWHLQATTPIPRWPEVASLVEYQKLTAAEQARYSATLSAAMNAAVVVSQPMAAACRVLDDVVTTNLQRPPGAMQMVAVIAPFSSGKSTLIKEWGHPLYRAAIGEQVRSDRPTWSPEPGVTADWCPVVYVTLMSSSSIKEVNAQILSFLGYPPEGLARTTTTRVLLALRMHGVRVVILDDANMLRLKSAQGRAVLDYIKFLNTELGERSNGTVILVGALPEVSAILEDPQIRARLTTLRLGPLNIDTLEERAAWQELLRAAEERPLAYLPGAAPGMFVNRLAQHVWRRTQGYVGEVAKLVAGSVMDAFRTGRNVITSDDLDAIVLSERSIDGQLDARAAEKKARK
jgi:hypothetical protein